MPLKLFLRLPVLLPAKRRAMHKVAVELPRGDEASDSELISRVSEWRSERHKDAYWMGVGGGDQWFQTQNLSAF